MDGGEVGRAGTVPTSRRLAGDLAEAAIAAHLRAKGWRILGRNVRVGRCELDIVALDAAGTLVIVEVRSRSAPGFGAPEDSIDAAKVARLYGAGWQLMRAGHLPDGRRLPGLRSVPGGRRLEGAPFRVDLVTVIRQAGTRGWRITRHLWGLSAAEGQAP
jgi:putative endonuclease